MFVHVLLRSCATPVQYIYSALAIIYLLTKQLWGKSFRKKDLVKLILLVSFSSMR